MSTAQFALFLIMPAGALLFAAIALYVTRKDRQRPHPHAGE